MQETVIGGRGGPGAGVGTISMAMSLWRAYTIHRTYGSPLTLFSKNTERFNILIAIIL